jgi:hypothetical protein
MRSDALDPSKPPRKFLSRVEVEREQEQTLTKRVGRDLAVFPARRELCICFVSKRACNAAGTHSVLVSFGTWVL